MRRTPILALLLLLAASMILAISITGPVWYYSSDGPYTNDTLYCNWSVSADAISQNISLLKNSVVMSSSYENASLVSLSVSMNVTADQTTKNDNWTCRIIAYNGTDELTKEVSVRIKNSQPSTEGAGAGIFYSGQDIGYVFNVNEDTTYAIDVNATDADGDTLTYLQGDAFCTRISSVQGTYSCTPNQSDLINNNLTLVNITLIATDGQNPGGRTITFNITPVNDAPRAVLSNRTTPVNTSYNMTFTATDEENGFPLSYALSAPAQIASFLSIQRTNSQGTGFSVYYDASVIDYLNVGAWTIEINVTDNSTNYLGANDSKTGTYSFVLNITAVGRKPYFTNVTSNKTGLPGVISLLQGESIELNFSANDPDVNSTLIFSPVQSYFTISTLQNSTVGGIDAQGRAVFTPLNSHVGVFNATVRVTDNEGLFNTTILQFNVTNVNDAPVISEVSRNSQNRPMGHYNMSDLVSYANTPFVYVVNASDIDSIYGDHLTFSDNTTLFEINSTSGVISFIPTDSDVSVSAYDVLVTAADDYGLNSTFIMHLMVNANSPPYFNATLPNITCITKSQCYYDFKSNAQDLEGNVTSYNLSFVGSGIANFSYNETTGVMNFTVAKSSIGNYTLNVTIYDEFGAYNWSTTSFFINNVPEAPVFTRYNISERAIVEMHAVSYELRATDEDLLVPALSENLVFTTNLSGIASGYNATITPISQANGTARALLVFTPQIGDAGSYSIELNVTDSFGLVDRKVLNFVVLAKAGPPNITSITPWGNLPNNTVNETYASTETAQLLDDVADLVFDENRTLTFGAIVSDPVANIENYAWTFDGAAVGLNSSNYTRTFDMFSSGVHTVTLNVSNDRYESSVFSWNLTVNNVNRAPQFLHNLTSLSVNLTNTINGYFYNYYIDANDSGIRFLDPDDDLNSNGVIDGAEVNRISFSTSNVCDYADLAISGANLVVDVNSIGTCYYTFNAADSQGLSTSSNLVMINVTDVPDVTPEPQPISGGGGGSTNPTVVPITKKYDVPKAFNLVAPKLVTIYDNKSLSIPISINNTWNAPLKMLSLKAKSNASAVNVSFDADFFEEIGVNETREVMITVSNYRMGSNYELEIIGNTTSPSYQDSALILLNSIESTSDGDDVEIKVTFANDLVNEHPECQELNEVLSQAKDKIGEGNIEEGTRLVDSVISGCKYLVSMQQTVQEKPSKLNPIITIDELSAKAIMYGVLVFVVLISVVFILFYHYTHKIEDDI